MHRDAIDLDDNCELFGNVDKKVNSSDISSAKSGKTQDSTPMEANVIANLVIKKVNEMFKPVVRAPEPPRFQKPSQCGICHGDHPTLQCALKLSQPPQFQNKLWCDYEKRWTNHNTEGCWQRLKLLREQDIAQQNQGNFRAGGEKAMPILGQQPPLPGNATVKIVPPEEEGHEKAIMHVQPYFQENLKEK